MLIHLNSRCNLAILLLLSHVFAHAQLSTKAMELRSNVVYLEAAPKDDPSNIKEGFGFIIGQEGNLLYFVTTYHTLNFLEQEIEEKNLVYKVQLFQSAARYSATLLNSWPNDDLSLLSVPVNTLVKWRKDCADFKPVERQKVTVIGVNKEWISPSEGPIISFDQIDFGITFLNNSGAVIRGTSGAPLINEKGIIGMVKRTEGTGGLCNALSLSRINALLASYANVFTLKPDGSGLVYIPAGSFKMGSLQGDSDAKNVHQVTLKAFFMMPNEVSFEEYEKFCRNTQNVLCPRERWSNRGNYPVINVSWLDIIAYCNWRSEQAGLEKVYAIGSNEVITTNLEKNGYRLPTEAEWEYAARGAKEKDKAVYGNGKDDLSISEINGKNKGINKTWTVDQGDANDLGLYNMSGNVAEWCNDYYSVDYYKESGGMHNPPGPKSGVTTVVRGGGWSSKPEALRVYARRGLLARFGYDDVGFRLVRNAE